MIKEYKYDEFIICPVRKATDETDKLIRAYIEEKEKQGKKIYWPRIDTNQVDPIGARICMDNTQGLAQSKKVSIFYVPDSQGSHFDIGITFLLYFLMGKEVGLINAPEDKEGKNFVKVIKFLEKNYSKINNARSNGNLEENILHSLHESSDIIREIYWENQRLD